MSAGNLILYTTEDGHSTIEVHLVNETVWLSLNQLTDLFQRDKSVISRHISNVFRDGELEQQEVVANFATTAGDGKTYQVAHFNLDVIISVGYRVHSLRGVQFRRWATRQLRDYLVKGFVLDDQRYKLGKGDGYFDQLLERIRDIRSSEKEFWRKVLDIYATSVDYEPRSETSRRFFATVQNKMHWAIHGKTAAEIIWERADAANPNAGLTNWPGQRPRQADAEFAKNYLTPHELEGLNRLVTIYLDFAEFQAYGGKVMTMAGWIAKLDDFLKLSGREVLAHAGKISHEQALDKARAEWEQYRLKRANEVSAVEVEFEKVAKTLGREIKQGKTK